MNELIGMWAFVFFIFDRKQLIFSRDRVGQKPLYFYNDEDNLIISSEAKSIFFILHGSGKRKVNDNYLLNFFNTGRLNQVIPFYKYIKKVAPGGVATYDLNNNKLHYFQKSFESLTNKNLINYNENDLENELNSSVKMCLRSDRKTAVLLSGGIDSSLISCIAKNYSSNLNFYSLFSSNKNVKKGLKDDIKYSNYLADKLGIKLIRVSIDDKKELNVDHLKEMSRIYDFPFLVGGTSIGLNLLYKKIAEDGIKVILEGTGADEIFGGYNTLMTENLRNAFISKNLYKIFYAYRKYLIFNFSKANKCLIHSFRAFIKLLLPLILYAILTHIILFTMSITITIVNIVNHHLIPPRSPEAPERRCQQTSQRAVDRHKTRQRVYLRKLKKKGGNRASGNKVDQISIIIIYYFFLIILLFFLIISLLYICDQHLYYFHFFAISISVSITCDQHKYHASVVAAGPVIIPKSSRPCAMG